MCALLQARLPSAGEQQHLADQPPAELSDEAAAKREREARGLTAYAMRHLRELQEQALLSGSHPPPPIPPFPHFTQLTWTCAVAAAVLASVVIDRVSADGSIKNGNRHTRLARHAIRTTR